MKEEQQLTNKMRSTFSSVGGSTSKPTLSHFSARLSGANASSSRTAACKFMLKLRVASKQVRLCERRHTNKLSRHATGGDFDARANERERYAKEECWQNSTLNLRRFVLWGGSSRARSKNLAFAQSLKAKKSKFNHEFHSSIQYIYAFSYANGD